MKLEQAKSAGFCYGVKSEKNKGTTFYFRITKFNNRK